MSVANYFTFIRLILCPIFLGVYLGHQYLGIELSTLPYILLLIFLISELTDAFDGYLARKYNQVTDLGKLLDPMADSISHITVFLTFTQPPVELPIFFIFIFLYRDSVISTLRTICALKGVALAARPSGKIKTALQGLATFIILLLMIPYTNGLLPLTTLQNVSMSLVGLACFYSALSGLEYIHANRTLIRKLLRLHQTQQIK